jgi:GTP-binding protein HflX
MAQKSDVESVLADLGLPETTPRIEAWNKLDLLDPDAREELLGEAARRDDVVALSALTGEGVDALIRTLSDRLTQGHQRYTITLDAADGASAAWLHQHGEVLDQSIEDATAVYEVRMSPKDFDRFNERLGGEGRDGA